MRTTKSKKPITVASVCVAAVACAVGAYRFVYLPLRPADVSHARISINATGKFDKSQIDDVVKADLARLKSWNGCRVDAVRYDAKRSAALLAAEHDVTASGGSSSISTAIDEYGMDNVIYLSNDILPCRLAELVPRWLGKLVRVESRFRAGGTRMDLHRRGILKSSTEYRAPCHDVETIR